MLQCIRIVRCKRNKNVFKFEGIFQIFVNGVVSKIFTERNSTAVLTSAPRTTTKILFKPWRIIMITYTNALCNISSDDVFTLCCYDEHIICYFFPPKSSKRGYQKKCWNVIFMVIFSLFLIKNTTHFFFHT